MTSTSDRKVIPDFQLPASTGHTLSFDSFRGKVPLALVFVPGGDSADSITLLEELDRRHKDFGAERSQLIAVTKQTARQVRDIADEHQLSVPILADASGAMARDFEVRPEAFVAIVATKDGQIAQRWDPFFEDRADPKPDVDSLLSRVGGLDHE